MNVSNGMPSCGCSGASGQHGMDNDTPLNLDQNMSQKLQDLSGMSQDGIESLVSKYAEKNGLSTDQAANQLIDKLQNPHEGQNLKEDGNGNELPDILEELVLGKEISKSDAWALFDALDVGGGRDSGQQYDGQQSGGQQGGGMPY